MYRSHHPFMQPASNPEKYDIPPPILEPPVSVSIATYVRSYVRGFLCVTV